MSDWRELATCSGSDPGYSTGARRNARRRELRRLRKVERDGRFVMDPDIYEAAEIERLRAAARWNDNPAQQAARLAELRVSANAHYVGCGAA